MTSPCIGLCRIDPESGRCEGCFRTPEEIEAWGQASEDEQRLLTAAHEQRRKRDPDADLDCNCKDT